MFATEVRSDADSPGGVVAGSFGPFATLLDRHLIEKTLENDGLVSALDYRAAADDPETLQILETQKERLAGFAISRLDTREKAIAFWNNAFFWAWGKTATWLHCFPAMTFFMGTKNGWSRSRGEPPVWIA